MWGGVLLGEGCSGQWETNHCFQLNQDFDLGVICAHCCLSEDFSHLVITLARKAKHIDPVKQMTGVLVILS